MKRLPLTPQALTRTLAIVCT